MADTNDTQADGYYGEDGKVQKVLEHFGVPYTGSDAFSSAIGMSKALTKKRFAAHGLTVPVWRVIRAHENVREAVLRIFREVSPPWVVKPSALGSSIGVAIARTFDELLA